MAENINDREIKPLIVVVLFTSFMFSFSVPPGKKNKKDQTPQQVFHIKMIRLNIL